MQGPADSLDCHCDSTRAYHALLYAYNISFHLFKGDVPFLILSDGSAAVKTTPERLPPPANSSDIYISVLTAPVYHDKRFAVQYLTWLQTVDVKNVSCM